jgi:RNA polymerase sigma-70 factor (ECF subfamily)
VPYDTPNLEAADGWRSVADAVRRFARRRTRCADLAEDIAQETVLRLMDYAQRQEVASLYALAFRIAENLIAEHQRRRRRHKAIELTDEIACPAPTPERVMEGREAVRALSAALARMPRLRREVIVRRRVLHQSCEAIALELDLSLKAVEKHVTRGLMDLKKAADAASAGWRNGD